MVLHMIRYVIALFLMISISGCSVMKINKEERQASRKLRGEDFTLNYLLYIPKDYHNPDKYPLVLFLHGSGERGNNLEKVKTHGPPRLVEEGKEFPFILVSPQCQRNERWDIEQLSILLDEIENQLSIDKDRIYVTGLSMGGYGTWKMAQSFPDRFAAIIPICGGGDFSNACIIKHIPVWAFHGSEDKVVSVQESERMVDALKACNGLVWFTIYPDAGHDSWTMTYNNPDIYEWMLKQTRKN
jgi:predicted peptidase